MVAGLTPSFAFGGGADLLAERDDDLDARTVGRATL
jgi:hypothetical protein